MYSCVDDVLVDEVSLAWVMVVVAIKNGPVRRRRRGVRLNNKANEGRYRCIDVVALNPDTNIVGNNTPLHNKSMRWALRDGSYSSIMGFWFL